MKLSARLALVAELVPIGARVADVGCDHGMLAIHLLKNGAARVIGSELREGPLKSAAENVRRAGLSGRLELRLCDGLSGYEPGEVDAVVLAGMGGGTVAQILSAAEWTRDPALSIIMQPMSSAPELRRFLADTGYVIERERLVRDAGRLYSVMRARWRGPYTLLPGEEYISARLREENDPLFDEFLRDTEKSVRRAAEGTKISAKAEDSARHQYFLSVLRGLRRGKTMPKVSDILDFLDSWAPLSTALPWDNCGLIAGHAGAAVSEVLVALDISPEVIEEAEELGAQLIVSHHPLAFSHVNRRVNDLDPEGSRMLSLIEKGMAAVCMHTNLDLAEGGVDDALAESLGLRPVEKLSADGTGRVCPLEREMELENFLAFVSERLGANGLRYVNSGWPVKKPATSCGSGGDNLLSAYRAGCDTLITADVKYNVFCDAKALGMNLIDAGHFPTENMIVPRLAERISAAFPELGVHVSKRLCQPEQFYIRSKNLTEGDI